MNNIKMKKVLVTLLISHNYVVNIIKTCRVGDAQIWLFSEYCYNRLKIRKCGEEPNLGFPEEVTNNANRIFIEEENGKTL